MCSASDAARDLLGELERQLAALEAQSQHQRPEGAQMARVILVGRICTALGGKGTLLPAVLGPADRWRTAVLASQQGPQEEGTARRPASSRSLAAAAAAPASAGEAFVSLQPSLLAVATRAFGLWASFAAATFAEELVLRLGLDPLLSAKESPKHWHQIQLAEGRDSGEQSAPGGLGGDAPNAPPLVPPWCSLLCAAGISLCCGLVGPGRSRGGGRPPGTYVYTAPHPPAAAAGHPALLLGVARCPAGGLPPGQMSAAPRGAA